MLERVPDRTTIWLFREALAAAGAIEALFAGFDAELKRQGYLALGGQIIDATIIEAPKQRLTAEEKATIKGTPRRTGLFNGPATSATEFEGVGRGARCWVSRGNVDAAAWRPGRSRRTRLCAHARRGGGGCRRDWPCRS